MFLQGASKLIQGTLDDHQRVIDEISGIIPEDIFDSFWNICIDGTSVDTIYEFIQTEITSQGYAASQFVLQLLPILIGNQQITSLKKARISQKLASVDYKLTLGSDELLQLMDLSGCIYKILHTNH